MASSFSVRGVVLNSSVVQRTTLLLILSLLLATLTAGAVGPGQSAIFHGTSVVILPNATSPYTRDTRFLSSNFFVYATPSGYLSFGWWLPASSSTNTSHCVPAPDSFEWYEYSNGTCDGRSGVCRHTIRNVAASDPRYVTPPEIPDDGLEYVVRGLDIGNPPHGSLALSYVDNEKYGPIGVGSRQVLSGSPDPSHVAQCRQALGTFGRILHEYAPPLHFELMDPCGTAQQRSSSSSFFSMQGWTWAWVQGKSASVAKWVGF